MKKRKTVGRLAADLLINAIEALPPRGAVPEPVLEHTHGHI